MVNANIESTSESAVLALGVREHERMRASPIRIKSCFLADVIVYCVIVQICRCSKILARANIFKFSSNLNKPLLLI